MSAHAMSDVMPKYAYQQPQGVQEVSLKDTTDWLATHLVGLKHSYTETTMHLDKKSGKPQEKTKHEHNVFVTILAARFDGCTLYLREQDERPGEFGGGVVFLKTYQTTLSQIESAQLTSITYPVSSSTEFQHINQPTSYSALILRAPHPTVIETEEVTGTGRNGQVLSHESSTDSSPELSIGTDDSAMAERVLAAFKNTIKLCHTTQKPEPF